MTAEQAARATHHKNPFVVEGEADGEEVVKDDKRERLGRLQQKLGNHGKLRTQLARRCGPLCTSDQSLLCLHAISIFQFRLSKFV